MGDVAQCGYVTFLYGGIMSTRYRGRIEITREALATLLGLPDSINIDLYFDYQKDMYQLLMRSNKEVIVNGQQLTFETEEGVMVPAVNYYLTERPKTIIAYGVDESPEPEPLPKDILDDFNDLLDQI